MTADVPRRAPLTEGARVRTIATTVANGSQFGGTRMAKTVPNRRPPTGAIPGVVVVIHGADGTVTRPTASIVMWVGAATPSNAVAFDLWYPATI